MDSKDIKKMKEQLAAKLHKRIVAANTVPNIQKVSDIEFKDRQNTPPIIIIK